MTESNRDLLGTAESGTMELKEFCAQQLQNNR